MTNLLISSAVAFRTRFMNSLNHIVGRTCIRFKKRTTEKDYIRVFQGNGCSSYVGRIGGRQELSLGTACTSFGTNVHEVIHAIGFYHEQSRSDRDDYVIINWDNIAEGPLSSMRKLPHKLTNLLNIPANQFNFRKLEKTTASTFNVPYDYDSVMHYSKFAFSMNGLETITVKSGAAIGQRVGMSDSDWTKVNNMYCPNTLAIRIRSIGNGLVRFTVINSTVEKITEF